MRSRRHFLPWHERVGSLPFGKPLFWAARRLAKGIRHHCARRTSRDGGRDCAVDVTVSHPLQKSQGPWSAEKAAGFLSRVEAAKTAKYGHLCKRSGWSFVPFGVNTWGSLGKGASQVFSRLVRRALAGVPEDLRPQRSAALRQSFSLALMLQVWQLLRPALEGRGGRSGHGVRLTRVESQPVPRQRTGAPPVFARPSSLTGNGELRRLQPPPSPGAVTYVQPQVAA